MRSRPRWTFRPFQSLLLFVLLSLDVFRFVILGVVRPELLHPPIDSKGGNGNYRKSDQKDEALAKEFPPSEPVKRPRVRATAFQGDLKSHTVQDLRFTLSHG